MDLRRVALVTLFASFLFACSSADTSPAGTASTPPSNVDEDDGDVVDGQKTTSGEASLLAPPPAFRGAPATPRALDP